MSSIITAKCPRCQQPLALEEAAAEQLVTCHSCQRQFIPAEVLAKSNRRVAFWMFLGLAAIGLGVIGYMSVTRYIDPKDPRPVEGAPAAAAAKEEAIP
jgi:hypothetical protein